MSERPWLFYDVAISVCATCLRRVDAKIVFQDDAVWMLKRCPEHGQERVLVADDVEYWRRAREQFLKPGELPRRFQTPVEYGCPYDCGLCPDHEQHSCVTLIEIGDPCNLSCPTCYAGSGPNVGSWRTLQEVERMLDVLVASEGEPDVVQLSGGEPTLHPDFFEIVAAARARPIRHLMVNTNGVRIARDPEFAAQLGALGPGFEVYLQFDSFEAGALIALRGQDLRAVREQALARLNEHGVSTTLVSTVRKGVNDHEIGRTVEYALEQDCVRGVTFQPEQHAGRAGGFDVGRHRLTLTEVRRRLLEQTSVFGADDVLPVPCHPDCIAMAYALKEKDGSVRPLTGLLDPSVLIDGASNTITFEREDGLVGPLREALSLGHSPRSGASTLAKLLCCLPGVEAPGLDYTNLFRVVIMQFLDAHAFDVRSAKKTCVHIVHPIDGRILPLDTYNLFYRGDLERTVLEPLRAARTSGAGA